MQLDRSTRAGGRDANAFEAAAALEAYELRMAPLWRGNAQPWDLARADAEVRRACRCCMLLPRVTAAAIALLLSHYRLLALLARRQQAGASAAPAAEARKHQACIDQVRRHCRELILSPRLH